LSNGRSTSNENGSPSSNRLWTDAELQAAVEAYLYVLRLQQVGIALSEREVTRVLLVGALRYRNDASIRYRLRNISSVMRDRGWPILSAYSPARQVGSGVKSRIEAMLDSHPAKPLGFSGTGLQEGLEPGSPIGPTDRERLDTVARLEALEHALADLKSGLVGIGHNQPPEPIDVSEFGPQDVQFAID
jgi:hypothetical protein